MTYTYIKFNGKLNLIRKYQLKPIKLPAHRHGYYQAVTHYGALTITKGDFLEINAQGKLFNVINRSTMLMAKKIVKSGL